VITHTTQQISRTNSVSPFACALSDLRRVLTTSGHPFLKKSSATRRACIVSENECPARHNPVRFSLIDLVFRGPHWWPGKHVYSYPPNPLWFMIFRFFYKYLLCWCNSSPAFETDKNPTGYLPPFQFPLDHEYFRVEHKSKFSIKVLFRTLIKSVIQFFVEFN
jgi:hypothetical protein